MDIDATEEEDATIEIGVEEKADNFAENFSKWPVFLGRVIIDQKGQCKDIECVTHTQIDHVDSVGAPAFEPATDGIHGGEVEQEAKHQHNAVDNWQQDVIKILT